MSETYEHTWIVKRSTGDQEIDTIRLFLQVLDQLEPSTRWRVLDYVTRRTSASDYEHGGTAQCGQMDGDG